MFELSEPLLQWHGHVDPNPVKCWEQHPWSRAAKGNTASRYQLGPHMALVEVRNLTPLEWVALFQDVVPNLGKFVLSNRIHLYIYETMWNKWSKNNRGLGPKVAINHYSRANTVVYPIPNSPKNVGCCVPSPQQLRGLPLLLQST